MTVGTAQGQESSGKVGAEHIAAILSTVWPQHVRELWKHNDDSLELSRVSSEKQCISSYLATISMALDTYFTMAANFASEEISLTNSSFGPLSYPNIVWHGLLVPQCRQDWRCLPLSKELLHHNAYYPEKLLRWFSADI